MLKIEDYTVYLPCVGLMHWHCFESINPMKTHQNSVIGKESGYLTFFLNSEIENGLTNKILHYIILSSHIHLIHVIMFFKFLSIHVYKTPLPFSFLSFH